MSDKFYELVIAGGPFVVAFVVFYLAAVSLIKLICIWLKPLIDSAIALTVNIANIVDNVDRISKRQEITLAKFHKSAE